MPESLLHRVVYKDDKCLAKQGTAALMDLHQEGVDAIVGLPCSAGMTYKSPRT